MGRGAVFRRRHGGGHDSPAVSFLEEVAASQIVHGRARFELAEELEGLSWRRLDGCTFAVSPRLFEAMRAICEG